ncbi:MAG TPA: hypothetical protein VG733_14200 [Chthoniobacteraceae bacterium]|nr:hypothetical protein [Chthoniobacteraceae bacterium]
MDDDFFRREYDLGPQKKDNLFLWTVCILLLTGAVLATWLGSFYVFGHPEIPRNYRLLLKLHKVEPPKRFEYLAAPPGDFYTAQKIYDKYSVMTEGELQLENANLLREYIRNYQTAGNSVPYITGQFTMINARELKAGSDIFPSGMVALAQCNDFPQVLMEYVYTAGPSSVADLKQTLTPGVLIAPQRTTELTAILHVQKLADGRLLLTAMPITYGSYTLKNSVGTFDLDPPTSLHLEGRLPITTLASIPTAGRNYAAAHTEATEGNNPDASPSASPASAQLVRVMPPLPVSTPKPGTRGSPQPTPAVARGTPPRLTSTPPPVPIVQVTPTPAPLAVATPVAPPPAFAQNVTPAPFETPEPETSGTDMQPTPAPTPGVAANNPNVQLQPFIQAEATPGTDTGKQWKVFKPGQMPRGKLLKITEAAELADRGTGGEELYLSGQFVVTASNENSAVLRAKGGVLSALNPLAHSNSVRVLVEFPSGNKPPAEGSTVSRDEMRPFEIYDVRRERNGTVDVLAREVTTPQ